LPAVQELVRCSAARGRVGEYVVDGELGFSDVIEAQEVPDLVSHVVAGGAGPVVQLDDHPGASRALDADRAGDTTGDAGGVVTEDVANQEDVDAAGLSDGRVGAHV